MKRIQICVARLCFGMAALMLFGSLALGQTSTNNEYPKVEIFAGFSALGENPREIKFSPTQSVGRGYATPAGLEISVVRNWTRYIGLKGDFSAHFKNSDYHGALTNCTPTCTTAIQDVQLKTRVFNFLAGPEFKVRNRTRLTPFAHLLGGVGHTSANFTTTGPTFNLALQRSQTGFAAALGGGLDVRASKRVSFRGLIDYNPVFINDSTANRRDLIRISLGLLFHPW